MALEQERARIIARVWQSVAESGVSLSSLPQDQVEALVGTIADNMLVTLNELLGEAAPPAAVAEAAAQGLEAEQTLWEGRPFLSISEHYLITTERLRITRGLFSQTREDVDLFRIRDLDQTQSIGERIANIGDIALRSDDDSRPEIVLRNIHDPLKIHEILRKAVLEARQRHRVGYREAL